MIGMMTPNTKEHIVAELVDGPKSDHIVHDEANDMTAEERGLNMAPSHTSKEFSSSENDRGNTITEVTRDESKKLFIWNLSLAFIHMATGIVLCVITDQNATVPVYSFFSDTSTRGSDTASLWAVEPKLLGGFPVGYWASASILISCLDHLLVATIFRKTYEYHLARKQNPFRWIEYAFSASIMHVLIAQLSGVFSVHLLFTVFGLSFVTMIFGHEQEQANKEYLMGATERGFTLRPFLEGCLPYIFAWAIIFCFFLQGVVNGEAPNFVWAIVFVLFFLCSTFALNQLLQQAGIWKWKNYIFGEVVFCVLSFLAKQLLAWLNYGGTQSI
jgi:hypothetical protein